MDYQLAGLVVAISGVGATAVIGLIRAHSRLSTVEAVTRATDAQVAQHQVAIEGIRQVQGDTREELAKMSGTLEQVVAQFGEARLAFNGMSGRFETIASQVASISSRLDQALGGRRGQRGRA